MFCDASSIWRFLGSLGALQAPEQARVAAEGLFLIEVFPALALAALDSAFFGRLAGPRYNPARGKTFRNVDWRRVAAAAASGFSDLGCDEAARWCSETATMERPCKADQDKLDSVLCLLVALRWRLKPRAASMMIGDLATGYMIAPASPNVRDWLAGAAGKRAVPVDGVVPWTASTNWSHVFLPGVDVPHVLQRLAEAGGNELDSGKLDSPRSSSALAANVFGWFIRRPGMLPLLPGMQAGIPAERVEVEYCARFPWRGGRHPWLDAFVETNRQIVGVESKRFEPYRSHKPATLSKAYDRKVWGMNMAPFEALRDALRSGRGSFTLLDATQLVKHAFGLVTEGRRKGRTPSLVYLYAEPETLDGHPIPVDARHHHREEIDRFAAAVSGAEVAFHAISYREWLADWPASPIEVAAHARAVIERFAP
jgi:hypothetical protein